MNSKLNPILEELQTYIDEEFEGFLDIKLTTEFCQENQVHKILVNGKKTSVFLTEDLEYESFGLDRTKAFLFIDIQILFYDIIEKDSIFLMHLTKRNRQIDEMSKHYTKNLIENLITNK